MWSTEVPRQPGYYWIRPLKITINTPLPLEIAKLDSDRLWQQMDNDVGFFPEGDYEFWQSPIPEPA